MINQHSCTKNITIKILNYIYIYVHGKQKYRQPIFLAPNDYSFIEYIHMKFSKKYTIFHLIFF